MVLHLITQVVNTMAKKVLETVTETPAVTTDSPYGDLMVAPEAPVAPPKKEDVRDYKKTPEVLEILQRYNTKSQAIRALHREGLSKGQIADTLRIRYQHVHNVLNQIVKRGS
jgi:spermidine/putrescine-binding protein